MGYDHLWLKGAIGGPGANDHACSVPKISNGLARLLLLLCVQPHLPTLPTPLLILLNLWVYHLSRISRSVADQWGGNWSQETLFLSPNTFDIIVQKQMWLQLPSALLFPVLTKAVAAGSSNLGSQGSLIWKPSNLKAKAGKPGSCFKAWKLGSSKCQHLNYLLKAWLLMHGIFGKKSYFVVIVVIPK